MYELLIFDLDGTLVQTEELANRVLAPLLKKHFDLHLTMAQHKSLSKGNDVETYFREMEQCFDIKLTPAFYEEVEIAWYEGLKNDLEPSEGAVEILDKLAPMRVCIASNSSRVSIQATLEATGLDRHFDHYFGVDEVASPKPAPDLYLLAAQSMDVAPEKCLAIEDSAAGVRAARDAGMRVIGFVGNDPDCADELRKAGAEVITRFDELFAIVTRDD